MEFRSKNDYDCKRAVRKDTECIIREAERSNKDAFHRLYKTDSIKPERKYHFQH